MNVYDTANKLAQEIRSSEEYKEFKNAKEKINSNPEMKKKIEDFENLSHKEKTIEMSDQCKKRLQDINYQNNFK